jgi:hypothetical protein
MDDIIEPNSTFDFTRLTLAQPTGIQGGAYFTKILYNTKSLYIQTPKSLTKQGFVKNGKKIYCDLMFDNNDEQFITWMENLETKCHNLIFEKSDAWFQNSLDLNDIESAFNSVLKSYKSGKKYLVRTNVKTNSLTGNPIIKIYNESEIPLTLDDVNHETNIISILEIQGIKFTTRNFQIEIELKQVMVLNTDKIFENCVIKKSNTLNKSTNQFIHEITQEEDEDKKEIQFQDNVLNSNEANMETKTKLNEEEKYDEAVKIDEIIDLDEENNDMVPIEISLNDDSLETITLKKPNQVYYELYKEAREKAKQAKKQAVLAYLQAENIKKTYMLDEIDSSDDDNIENMESDLEIED